MNDISQVQSISGKLPRIGDLIEQATGIKYDTYARAQKELGLEAAMAAIATHPEYRHEDGKGLADVVYGLLHKQARLRMEAVKRDAQAISAGMTLKGRPVSSYLMVQMVDKAPAGLEDVLARALAGVEELGWKRAEGASNASNFARDVIATLPEGAPAKRLKPQEIRTLDDGIYSADMLVKAITKGRAPHPRMQAELETHLGLAMDMATRVHPEGVKTEFRGNYDHYRDAMKQGIHEGLEATRRQAAREFGR